MSRIGKSLWAAIACLSSAPLAAQTASWQVIAGENATVVAPNLPAGATRQLADVTVADLGGARFGLRLTSPSAQEGYWAQRQGQWTRYTQLNTTGALGPGRSGAEAGHVFLSIDTGGGDAAPDGRRVFFARASDPAVTLNATYGLWRWDGTANVEVARASTDGVLGPGLGAGWVFPNTSGFADARMLDGGAVLLHAEVRSPTNASSRLLARHAPGAGQQPCMRTGATEAAFAPGLSAGDSFLNITAGLDRLGVTPGGRVYARLQASGSREGLWELCDGAPRAIAVNTEPGARGPDIGIATAIFSDFAFATPQPSGDDGVVFFANWRDPPAGSRLGLFRHDGQFNRGIAYTEPSGFFGPNWLGATWRSFDTGSLSVSGPYAAFVAGLDTADNGDPTGLWRVRAGDRPELVALLGIVGAPYEPEPGRTWRSFDALAVMHNGDLVLEATTNPNATKDLWLLQAGRAPRRLLSIAQTIAVPTTQGTVNTTISSFDLLDGGATFAEGKDTWIARDGSLVVPVNVANLGRVYITTRLAVPDPDVNFANDFE
jgi:hypothetical protein